MSIVDQKAEEIIRRIGSKEAVSSVRASLCSNDDEWYRFSSKAYNKSIALAKKERRSYEQKRHVLATKNNQIDEILTINNILADYALLIPIFSTLRDLSRIKELVNNLPTTESEIMNVISEQVMSPRLRALQKKGRLETFEHFKIFSKLIDAALISYFRTNFISCYLTLLPIVEGIIIRWMGYSSTDTKPEFEDIRKFFKNSYLRQPCPANILFYDVYNKVCDKILNQHFYKPTTTGSSYANFNRHVASHLLNDDHFATKDNCIRLFLLIDTMTEIYHYEFNINDPRFELSNEDIAQDVQLIGSLMLDNLELTPEHILLGTSIKDIVTLKNKKAGL